MYIRQTPVFLNPTEPLRNALASLPGYDAHVNALDALKAPRAAATAAQQDANAKLANVTGSLADTLLKTPATKAAGVIESRTAEAAAATEAARKAAASVTLIDTVEERLGTGLDDIVRPAADHILAHLNGTVQDAYARSRELGLQGIADAEQAIAAGKAAEWAEMIALRTTIFHARAAQSTITGRLGSIESIQRLTTFGLLANYAELFPGWHERLVSAKYGNEDLMPPWPLMADGTSIDPIEMHQWILDNPEAEPWVPTTVELAHAIKTAELHARKALDDASRLALYGTADQRTA